MKRGAAFAVLAAAGALSACGALNEMTNAATATPSGAQDVAEVASAVSVVGDSSAITRRSRRQLPDRYQEWLELRGGVILYERLYSIDTDALSEVVLRDQFFGGDQSKSGIKSPSWAVNPNGIVHFVIGNSGSQRCVTFQQYIGSTAGRHDTAKGDDIYREYIRGNQCGGSESETLDLLARLRFDRGLRNEARAYQPSRTGMLPERASATAMATPNAGPVAATGQLLAAAPQASAATPAPAVASFAAERPWASVAKPTQIAALPAATQPIAGFSVVGTPPHLAYVPTTMPATAPTAEDRPWNVGVKPAQTAAAPAAAPAVVPVSKVAAVQPPSPAPRNTGSDVVFSVQWEGTRGTMTGTMRRVDHNGGTVSMSLPLGASQCNGIWTMADATSRGGPFGSWSLFCDNGRTAFGGFRGSGFGQGGGDGRDTSGRRVSFTFTSG
jgi:hypothetical protein